jgi:hypothetical protein
MNMRRPECLYAQLNGIGVRHILHWQIPTSPNDFTINFGIQAKAIRGFLCLLLLLPVLAMWLALARSVPRRPLLLLPVVSAVLLTGFFVYCGRHDKYDGWTQLEAVVISTTPASAFPRTYSTR